VPSAEQIDNRRRGRAEDRIPQIAQDRIGLLTFTVRNKAPGLARKTGGSHRLRTRQQQVSPSVVRASFRGSGGCGIRTREGLHPTRFPSCLRRCSLGFLPSAMSAVPGPDSSANREERGRLRRELRRRQRGQRLVVGSAGGSGVELFAFAAGLHLLTLLCLSSGRRSCRNLGGEGSAGV
jgi:hypothetical protein